MRRIYDVPGVPKELQDRPYADLIRWRAVRYAAMRLAKELVDAGIDHYNVGLAIEDHDSALLNACARSGINEAELMSDDAAIGRAVVDLTNWIMGGLRR